MSAQLITNACPVAYRGELAGQHYYFRARWDRWQFAVADTFDLAVDAVTWPSESNGAFYREGYVGEPEEYAASWMPLEQAETLLLKCLNEYVKSRLTEYGE